MTKVVSVQSKMKSWNPRMKHSCGCSTGWITTWGEAMANTSAELMMSTLTDIVEYANNTGSVNLYMAHGGTNFGYWAGEPLLWKTTMTGVSCAQSIPI